jgi:hypothetical protein
MAKKKDPANPPVDIVRLLLTTGSAIILVLVVRAVYLNIHKIVRRLRRILTAFERRLELAKINKLLDGIDTGELAKIAFSVWAWPKVGFPDQDLYISRPTHYRSYLKKSSIDQQHYLNEVDRGGGEFASKARGELIKFIDNDLQNRSLLSLKHLRKFLSSTRGSTRVSSTEAG